MSKRVQRSRAGSIVPERLESRTLWSASPVLSADVVSPTNIGQLVSSGKLARFVGSMPNGSPFIVELKDGSAALSQLDSSLYLTVTGTTSRSQIKILGAISIGGATFSGPLNLFEAQDAALIGDFSCGSLSKLTVNGIDGSFAISGSLGVATIGSLNGTLAATGAMKKLTIGALHNAHVLSGASLGANGVLGGGDDSFSAGSIASLTIAQPVINSDIIVGVNPGTDGVFGTADDFLSGGGLIGHLTLTGGADSTSHIEAGGFGVIKTTTYGSLTGPKRLKDPLTDSHFSVPSAPVP